MGICWYILSYFDANINMKLMLNDRHINDIPSFPSLTWAPSLMANNTCSSSFLCSSNPRIPNLWTSCRARLRSKSCWLSSVSCFGIGSRPTFTTFFDVLWNKTISCMSWNQFWGSAILMMLDLAFSLHKVVTTELWVPSPYLTLAYWLTNTVWLAQAGGTMCLIELLLYTFL